MALSAAPVESCTQRETSAGCFVQPTAKTACRPPFPVTKPFSSRSSSFSPPSESVLGTIPEFSFAAIEHAQRRSEKGILGRGDRRRYPYPPPLDEEEPEPARQRAKVKSRRQMGPKLLLLLIVLVALAAAVFLVPWGKVVMWMRGGASVQEPQVVEPEKKEAPEGGAGDETTPADAGAKTPGGKGNP